MIPTSKRLLDLFLTLVLAAKVLASPIDTLVEDVSHMGTGGLEEARKSAAAHAASSGEQLGHHSIGLETLRFAGYYTPPEAADVIDDGNAYGMAIFSDDGCELKINGEVVHSRYRKGQALPRLKDSFHELDVTLEPGEEVYIELSYSNVSFITRGNFADIDGATIYIFNKAQDLGLAVDANRDGDIRMGAEPTSQGRPYRFWINNDYDRSEDKEGPKEWRRWWKLDHDDERIRTQRDLEDFTRLQMVINEYHEELKEGDVEAVLTFDGKKLKGQPAIRIWPHLDPGGSRAYLVDEDAAEAHTNLKPLGVVAAGEELVIPRKYWQGKKPFRGISPIGKGKSRRHMLYEGISTGQGALVLELRKDGKVLSSSKPCWLKLMDVREMYQRAKVTPEDPDAIPEPSNIHGEEGNPLVAVPEPNIGWTWDPWGKPFDRDPYETKKYLIFVHGWRMTYDGSQKYGETMFKRCWQAGYKGRFLFIRWPTYSEDTNPITDGYTTYNVTDYRAWKSGKGVAQIVNSLPSNYKRSICAHSMGNIVVGSAFREGMKAENYALFNAAAPAMCYDSDEKLLVIKKRTPDDDVDPITRSMGFAAKFEAITANEVINFYLPRDKALRQWRNNNRVFKPNRLGMGLSGYRYFPNNDPGEKLQLRRFLSHNRHLRSIHEAAAYATKSKSITVGAEGKTSGVITNSINMSAKYKFGATHSAEWLWRSQKTMPFFSEVLKQFKSKPTL